MMVDPSDPLETGSPEEDVPTAVPVEEDDETKPTNTEEAVSGPPALAALGAPEESIPIKEVEEAKVSLPPTVEEQEAKEPSSTAPEAEEATTPAVEEVKKVLLEEPEEPAKSDATAAAPDTDEKETALAEEVVEEAEGGIWDYGEYDVLCGRGASVNAHSGNKKFRAICFVRKTEFEAANHAAKRRIATEIVKGTMQQFGSRFLKRKADKGPWYEMTKEQALLKACQVMRDHKRPDRLAQRELMAASGKKRNRATSTPLEDVILPPVPAAPLVENPFGVHDHDILCGRGAFVNGHIGNSRLRTLAVERKLQFDSGNYTEKRALATEIVSNIRGLTPPGRFLRRVTPKAAANSAIEIEWAIPPAGDESGWEELTDEKAIHKACQVMRDIDRPDRKERDERRKLKKLKNKHVGGSGGSKEGGYSVDETTTEVADVSQEGASSQAVEEAVAAAEEAMDKALEAASTSASITDVAAVKDEAEV